MGISLLLVKLQAVAPGFIIFRKNLGNLKKGRYFKKVGETMGYSGKIKRETGKPQKSEGILGVFFIVFFLS